MVVLQPATTVAPITDPTVTAAQQSSCNGGNDGSVTLTELADQVAIFTATTLLQDLLLIQLYGLQQQVHHILFFYVKDSKGCVGSVFVVNITEPTA
jgi:hypothetical protein